MPIPWDKVMAQRPHVVEAARGWYEKWIRGERPKANGHSNGAETSSPVEKETVKVEAYAEPIHFQDVVEVKETAKDIASRLEALEFSGMAQAETLKNLSAQNQALTQRLSELQQALNAVSQEIQEERASSASHKNALENLERRTLHLSTDMSRMMGRIKAALWTAGIGLAGAVAAIVLVVMR